MIKPILFNTKMVQAILDGRKTTTRRVIKVDNNLDFIGVKNGEALFGKGCCIHETMKPPYMKDILYVRETWMISNPMGDTLKGEGTAEYVYKAGYAKGKRVHIIASQEKNLGVWQPSIHMPKEAARIFLKVTDVRVERLQDISEVEALKEGAQSGMINGPCSARFDFQEIWDKTVNKKDIDKYGWNANPWVWVIEFERCEKP